MAGHTWSWPGPTSSSQELIPHPRSPAARLLFAFLYSCRCFLPPGEILKSGVGIFFCVPTLCDGSSRRCFFRAALGDPPATHLPKPLAVAGHRSNENTIAYSFSFSCIQQSTGAYVELQRPRGNILNGFRSHLVISLYGIYIYIYTYIYIYIS